MIGAMAALSARETKAAMGPRGPFECRLGARTDVHQPSFTGFAVREWTLGVAVNFSYRPLTYVVDDAVNYPLQDGHIAKICESCGLSFQVPEG